MSLLMNTIRDSTYLVKQARKNYKKKTVGKENKMLATRSFVKRAIKMHGELKEKLVTSTRTGYNTLADGTWEQDTLLQIAQGDGDSNRDGDKIEIARIQLGNTILYEGGDGAAADVFIQTPQVRVLVFQCKRGYSIAEVLATLPTANATTPLSFATLRLCDILYDKVYHQDDNIGIISAATPATSTFVKYPQQQIIKLNLKPKIKIPTWNPGTTTSVDPDVVGALSMAYCMFLQGAATSAFTVAVQDTPDVRITFRDK